MMPAILLLCETGQIMRRANSQSGAEKKYGDSISTLML
jgi:hypothetical protein